MARPIFIDANVPMYGAGRPHPLKEPCAEVLRLTAQRPEAFFTNAEVLQELLHRYLGSGIWPAGQEVLRRFAGLMSGRVVPVLAEDVEAAAHLAGLHPGLSARDLLHAAIMARLDATCLVSTDGDFDRLPHLHRLAPADWPSWREVVGS